MTGESCTGEWPRENGIRGSTPLAGANYNNKKLQQYEQENSNGK